MLKTFGRKISVAWLLQLQMWQEPESACVITRRYNCGEMSCTLDLSKRPLLCAAGLHSRYDRSVSVSLLGQNASAFSCCCLHKAPRVIKTDMSSMVGLQFGKLSCHGTSERVEQRKNKYDFSPCERSLTALCSLPLFLMFTQYQVLE